MRFRTFKIARLFGIPIIVDFTWLPVVALHIWLASSVYLPRQTGYTFTTLEYYVFGVIMSVLLFASIVAHELAHALAARLERVQIVNIQLHVFGGWTRLVGEPSTPLGEFRIAVAGPSASFVVGLGFFICLALVEWLPNFGYKPMIERMFVYLFIGNLVLAMFNLLPGLPLDGGRALRAWLWHRSGDIVQATKTSKRMGIAIAYMLSSFGLFSAAWWGDYLSGAWLVVVGFFLYNVARANDRQQVAWTESLREPGTIGERMSAPAVGVPPDVTIDDFIERVLSSHRHTTFPVMRDGRLHGIVSLERMRSVPKEAWSRTLIREVMEPVNETLFISSRASVPYAVNKLSKSGIGHLAVVDNEGLVVGYVSRADLH